MNAKNMKKKSNTDWKRLDAMKDEDIDISDPDCIPMTEKQLKSSKFVVFQNGIKSTKEIHEAFEKKYGIDLSFFKRAKIEEPLQAKTISLRIPIDLLEWWKLQGKGYQTRMIALMRAYMQDQLKKTKAA